MFSLILGMLITFPQYKKVRYNQFQVLSLFLEMPEYKMKELHNSCEMYLTNLQQDDVEVEEDAQVGANNASILQSTIY
jgi:hypothetical protein